MGIDATGKLHTIFDTKQVSERFSKREFVLEISDGKYPQVVLFQLTGDRCMQLDNLKVGDDVRVEYSLRGREWRSPAGELKYFNSLDVWKVEAASASASNGRRNSRGGNTSGMSDRGDAPAREYDPRPSDSGNRDMDDIPF
ncbi:MAG: DUF3127 domain-containing protein [Deltaproteobacteria bacterium]|nr:DUF3127 domain-containing protein [Deltaproteobacteria bacterium]